MTTIEGAKDKATNLLHELERFLKDYQNIEDSTDRTSLTEEELYETSKLYEVSERFDEAVRLIKQMNKPVLIEGYLTKNENNRYSIGDFEFTSGSAIEVWEEDDYYSCGGYWITTRIEHSGDYYAVALGKDISLEGKRARAK